MKDSNSTNCDNCMAAIAVGETHSCETCGATLCPECVCENCENDPT